ncbi:MAG: hypothetical protein Q8910_00270 [Bacteroidota bacterium]|nr:hypothetical protein [Bacteroidota bacterium]
MLITDINDWLLAYTRDPGKTKPKGVQTMKKKDAYLIIVKGFYCCADLKKRKELTPRYLLPDGAINDFNENLSDTYANLIDATECTDYKPWHKMTKEEQQELIFGLN